MTDARPAPLVPPEVDLRDFAFMPLEINRLRKSKAWLWAKRQPALGFYMLNLWATSWHETPAASLEDDDDVLADAAMCDLKSWPKVKEKVLHGWVKCSDGRLYHPIVAEKALEAWAKKTKQRQRTAAATKARQSALTTHNLIHNSADVSRDDERHEDRNDVESEQRNEVRDDYRNEQRDGDVTFTKGQGRDREGKGQGEKKKEVVARVARPKRTKSPIPEICPSEQGEEDAKQFWAVHARFDLLLDDQAAQFRDHHMKLDTRFADWDAAWRTWYRNALKFNRQQKGSSHDKGTEGLAIFLAKVERGNGTGHRDRTGEAGSGPRLLETRHGPAEMGDAVRDLSRGSEGSERRAASSGLPGMAEQPGEHEIPDAGPTQGSVRPVQNIIAATAASLSRNRR